MQDRRTRLKALRRPALLVRAARHGQADYRRAQHLPRLLGYGALPAPGAALAALMEMEETHEARRREDDAAWSAARHVEVLIALMAEARLAAPDRPGAAAPDHAAPEDAATGAPQEKASGISALRAATKSPSASATPGSSGGASYRARSDSTRAAASACVSRAPSSSQVSNGL